MNGAQVGCRGPGELRVSVAAPAYGVAVRNARGDAYKPRPQGPGPVRTQHHHCGPKRPHFAPSLPPHQALSLVLKSLLPWQHQALSLVLKVAPSLPQHRALSLALRAPP